MITSGEGKYKVFLEKHQLDDGLIYMLGGGQRSHIGGIVLCEPNKKPQILKLGNHYDYIVLEPIAKEACKKYKIKTAILTVPAITAQIVCNDLVEAGITGIMSFAPIVLKVPKQISVNNINLCNELEATTYTAKNISD